MVGLLLEIETFAYFSFMNTQLAIIYHCPHNQRIVSAVGSKELTFGIENFKNLSNSICMKTTG